MQLHLILIILMCFPILALGQGSMLGNRSEAEIRAYNEEDARRKERINHTLEEIRRREQESINGLEDRVLAGILQSSAQNQSNTSNETTATTARSRVGLTISTDNSTVRTSSAKAVRTQQRKNQREQEHREWLEQRQEAMRQQAEREKRRLQEEKRRQQEHYNRVYTTEYAREGYRSRRLSDQADWRVGEGTDIMDRTHTANSLMTRPVQRNFGNTPNNLTQRHGIRSLSHRSTFVLDPHAIPWGTMSADARPWEEWEKNRARQTVYEIVPPMPAKPAIPLNSPEVWVYMQDNLGKEKTNMIRAAVNHECNGIIPDIRYENGCYHLYDQESHKVISVDADGSSITVHQLTEKDDHISDIWKNIKKSTSLSMNVNAPLSLSSTATFTPGSDKEIASYSGKVGIFSGKVSNKGYSVSAGGITGESDYNGDNKNVSVNIKQTNSSLDNKGEKSEISGKLSASIKALENSSEITHRKYFLSSSASTPSLGIGGSAGMGITVKGSAAVFAEFRKLGGVVGRETNIEATLAKSSLDATVMAQPPLYKGMCFATASIDGKLGYSYSFKRETGSGATSIKAERNIGALPLSFSGAGTLKCYQPQEYSLSQSETPKP